MESAQAAIDWYLRDKLSKRRASRILRGMSIILAAIGGIVPQLGSLGLPDPNQEFRIGYVAFALAAACVAFDYFFGLSSGWMRDIAAAQSLQAMVREFDLKWLTESTRLVEDPISEHTIAEFLAAIQKLLMGVEDVIADETGEWKREFSKNIKSAESGFGTSSAGGLTGTSSH